MDAERLDELAAKLEGDGWVVRRGYVTKAWGDPSEKVDWSPVQKLHPGGDTVSERDRIPGRYTCG